MLEHEVLRGGTIVTRCPRCDRRNRGICADCPNPVEGRTGSAMRCRECKRRARTTYSRRYEQRDPERNRRQYKAFAARRKVDPVRRAHDLATKKAWRARNVARIKMQKRKWRLNPNRPGGYSSREKHDAYHRRYRESHRAHYRELARRKAEARRLARGPIPCACGCGQMVPWDGRYRPAKWVAEHRPWPYQRPRTPMEVLMKASARAVEILERAAAKVREKLADVKPLQRRSVRRSPLGMTAPTGTSGASWLQAELTALESAIATLRPVAGVLAQGVQP